MKKALIGLFIAILLVSELIYFNQPNKEKNNDKEIIKIGVVYPMTGSASFMGTGAKNAVALFQDKMASMNLKHHYEFVLEDSQAQPSVGLSAAMKLINLDQVDVIVDTFSGVAIAIGNLTERAKIPHFSCL